MYPPPVAYAAPIAFAATMPATSSVRPLVVSHAPPIANGGGGFGRFLVAVALLAGVSVTAYRNDLLRDGAHAAHQDALYARLEGALGGPAFGTLRALDHGSAAQPAFETSSSHEAPIRTALTPPSPAPASAPAPAIGATTTPVVSLESIAAENKAQTAVAPTPVTKAAVTPTPVHALASFAKPSKAAATPARTPAPRATPKVAVEKPAPIAHKPASDMSERERLNAAIGQSMMQSAPPKAKAKSKASEYDPLNPSL